MSFQNSPIGIRFHEMMKLGPYLPRTRESYLWAIKGIAQYYNRSPESLTEEELRKYLLFCRDEKNYSASTMRQVYRAIRLFYEDLLERNWKVTRIVKGHREKRLPVVLSKQELKRVLSQVNSPYIRTFFITVYSMGLRLGEALELKVSDIDRQRMVVHIRQGKGGRDRYVPLPAKTLALLGEHWQTHRNPQLLFPRLGRHGNKGATSTHSISRYKVQSSMRRAVEAAGISKTKICIHTLRHCYATHLLEDGASIRSIQQNMGHSSLRSTIVYLHLTQPAADGCRNLMNSLVEEL